MAISTYKVFLMKKKTDPEETYEKLVDIKEFPDLGGEPEMLETTTLSDNMQTYIAGIQSLDGLSFTANYDMATFKKLKELCRLVRWNRVQWCCHSRWLQRQVRL